MSFHATEIQQEQNNKLQAKFNYNFRSEYEGTLLSPTFIILGGLTSVQVKLIVKSISSRYDCSTYVRFETRHKNCALNYQCKVSLISASPRKSDINCFGQDSNWHEFYNYKNYDTDGSFTFLFDVQLMPTLIPIFSSLYDDEDLTDFKLCGEDGAITVHRLVLAAHSPVLKTMLTGSWKETTEGRVDIAGTTAQTLENLKKFLYLDQLPDTLEELELLVVLAGVYIMKELAQKCSAKILLHLKSDNAAHFMQLACQYKLKLLFVGIIYSSSFLSVYFLTASINSEEWL